MGRRGHYWADGGGRKKDSLNSDGFGLDWLVMPTGSQGMEPAQNSRRFSPETHAIVSTRSDQT